MPLALAGLLIGALLGAYRAKALGGKPADMAQYAAGFGILFAVIGFFAAVLIARLSA